MNCRRRAVFLDRDGVINQNRDDYVKDWSEFVFLPGVFRSLKCLSEKEFLIVVISNQSAIGRGLVDKEIIENIHNRMRAEIKKHGGRIDTIYYCPHTPEDKCGCRKPKPGLIKKAKSDLELDLKNSYLIGDAVSDMEAAVNSGCSPIFVLTGRGEEQINCLKQSGYNSVPVVSDLKEAVDLIIEQNQ